MSETILFLNKTTPRFAGSLIAPKHISPYSTLTMKIIPEPLDDIDWKYLWTFEYIGVTSKISEQNKIENAFKELTLPSNLNRVISVPSKYLVPNSTLKVIIYEFNSFLSAPLSEVAVVKIADNEETAIAEIRYFAYMSSRLFN